MFHQVVESKTACHGKQDGKYRYNGEQCAICQCGSFISHPVFGKPVDTKIDGLYNIVE